MPLQYLAPRRLLKSIIKHSSLRRWQEEWDNGLTGENINQILHNICLTPAPWNRQDIILATGHLPHISNAFTSKNLTAAVGKWAFDSITPPADHPPLPFTSPNSPRISKLSGGIKV
ncbi:hypothetical protein AVEN_234174-1 [Araneus ventricosus]|uniref:Uncharacterized protein n=1 Tax=Araneus ventricosus TaxID=182803 RepID=A0A4Y2L5C7_ARAVE|nr:hypothetical protein AVEN_234174-1 [Araneus ventricosus]